jgi:hypothetical protein
MPVQLMSAIDEASATSSSANRLVADEDALLVAAATTMDNRAFELLVERHERKIFFNGSAHNPQSGRRRRCREAGLPKQPRRIDRQGRAARLEFVPFRFARLVLDAFDEMN